MPLVLATILSGPLYYLVIGILLPTRRQRAIEAAICLVALAVSAGAFHESINPPRLGLGDLVVLGAAITGLTWALRSLADLAGCTVFAFFQSTIFLPTYLDPRYDSAATWFTCAGVYTSCAVIFCWLLRLLPGPKPPRDGHPRCARCGYDLFGLPEPRCPECGTPVPVNEPP